MNPLSLLCLSILFIGCSGKDGGTATDSGGGTNCDEDGAILFANKCAACHGSDGTQRDDANLETGVSAISDSDLAEILSGGIGSMADPGLTLCEEDAVFLYVRETFGQHGGG